MRRLKYLIVGASLLASAAHAQNYVMPQIPSEEAKVAALKEAYRLNGNSMVGWGSIDLTAPAVPGVVRTIPIIPRPPIVDKGVDKPVEKPVRVAQVAPTADICTRHHRRKVYTNNGKSWHCR